jgi:hypothetical protein
MANFPPIKPTSRVYVPGLVPSVLRTSLSGATVGFRRGNRRIAQSLEMQFSHLTQAEMLQIKDHYINSNGTFEIFFLSAQVWADHASPPVPLLSDFAWRYAGEPAIEDASYDRFTVSVSLQTEPIDSGDLIFDGGLAAATPARDYIVNGGLAAAMPARDYIIAPGGA